ncbi:hypothetical protein SCUCBS95973_009103 [Sporothrix curviconia]|uniref:Uncharacterized protein n=1 Tax=Sporothrix curviconia TaxID=1260050 RepID=A0ABP0CSQ0_9PEZI
MLPQDTRPTAALDDASTTVPDVLFSNVYALSQHLDAVASDDKIDSLVVGNVSEQNSSTLVPDVLFSNVDALFQLLDAVAAGNQIDSLVVGNVSEQNFRAIEAERDGRGRHYRFLSLPDFTCTIITIPTGRHEEAHRGLYDIVSDAFRAMGLRNQWTNIGSETFNALRGASGEGDSPGGPRSRYRGGIQAWPTLVIEAGATKTMPSLRIKGMWWFTASDYHMKVVVLVKLFPAAYSIRIEKWVAPVQPGQQRHGATTTRASRAVRRPVLDQQLLINWAGPASFPQTPINNRVLADFQVDGAPLILRFQELMEREPVTAAGECDILITEEELQDLAMHVWERA